MAHSVIAPSIPRRTAGLSAKVVLPIVVLLMLVGLFLYLRAANASAAPGERYALPISAAIEEKFGVRFTFLAVTAGGGLIDLRYRIVDAGKAKNFGHYTETAPMLIAEDSGAIIDVTKHGLHNHRVQPGLVFHVLFRNTGSAIQTGKPVTIQVGDLKLEHVLVQ
ncbi:MAG TPA: hypothetical protein VJG32_08230 [Anaerolineae bacterium]|nr:hypothetical protein [Anaerolineae bacterium]